jgi:glutamate 5-kinase
VTPLEGARRLVVKIGSSILVDETKGEIRRDWLETLTDDVARLHKGGCEVVVVSSGAIRLGRTHFKLAPGPLKLEESQAAAATGQIQLAHAYQEALARHGITVAQVLLTLDDSEERRRYLNARQTMATLLAMKAVPVINENDTVATAEIRYGDNDRLAARVAQMASADCLVLLSDVAGLYSADPNQDPGARLIREVRHITPEIEAMAGRASSALGSGGMRTKILAARIAVAAGCHMCVAAGKPAHPLRRIEEGADCTWFVPSATPAAARKQWIAGTLRPSGALIIDDGALRALTEGRSLLPAGITAARGRFDRGDTVSVFSADGREVARGIVAYSDADAARIMGRRSGEIAELLGFRGRDEMIHRDDLVLMRPDVSAPRRPASEPAG